MQFLEAPFNHCGTFCAEPFHRGDGDMKVAFLDRDGTIVRDYADDIWRTVTTPEFLEGSIEALKAISELGYKIIVVTNQYLIDEGFITRQDYFSFTDQFLDVLKSHDIEILDIFHCPHARNSGCECCKPKPGLIRQALARYPDIRLSESFMCGDSWVDMELARNTGLRFFGIGMENDASIPASSLSQIVQYLTQL